MIWIGIVLLIAGVDLAAKAYIEKKKKLDCEEEKLGGKVIIRKHHNRGAILNIGSDNSQLVKTISVGLCISCTLIFFITLTRRGKKLLKLSLAMMLGGSFSNTYDRLKRKYVVDFISFRHPFFEKHGMKKMETIIFNIGDFGILLGAALLLLREAGKETAEPIKKSYKKSIRKLKSDINRTKKHIKKKLF